MTLAIKLEKKLATLESKAIGIAFPILFKDYFILGQALAVLSEVVAFVHLELRLKVSHCLSQ